VRVGLLFPGEMGAEIGKAVREEVVWASEGRSEATAGRAQEAGLVDVGTVEELVRTSEIVLSVCPPAIAEDVATQVFDLGFDRLYVEANAISPGRMKRIAELSPRMLDGSILGALHFYLSGDKDDVARVADLFAGSAVTAIPLEGGIGAASALKMAYAGWNKIGIALTAQAHAIAREHGVGEALASEGVDANRFVRSAGKAWRWAPEMAEIAHACEELGLPEGIPRGAADLYGRWNAHRDTEVATDRLLDDLVGSKKENLDPK
jgi:3-hydroxyisobutyrate dehydrogenase-like beta-hydroxyacid dehydrogenase